jgi:hypothetical protein
VAVANSSIYLKQRILAAVGATAGDRRDEFTRLMARLLLRTGADMVPRDSDVFTVIGVVATVALLGLWRMLAY